MRLLTSNLCRSRNLYLWPLPSGFIIQVINIINAAQESSPMPVAEALDRVLEILRTTELYSPQLGTKDEDPHTNDLVGGLMTVREVSPHPHPPFTPPPRSLV